MKLALLMAVVLLVSVRNGKQATMSCPRSKFSKQMYYFKYPSITIGLLHSGTKREGVVSKSLPSANVI